ncbi:BamA/TamA family outer membrane protein [Siphonobacter aquaeclarae]|jgi:outer membrane protein assembly factor BamA|uniref:Surface antigen variable number repeat-containing protein n=1 Tax=Siphonobacter aquaeclarae TaxID=563176 RepID=A0A1G9PQU7_9BACT|nr:BamA/TamA family outer membrane protein [Siphonobacter aquaeclarae]MBO9638877.1 BamA/TamA family outer membrane protein [Siphonobacter aquaeclarae]SDM01069.1 Surface antigen variable number repeat-containing protein [Siphonobacter aquaeclarae]
MLLSVFSALLHFQSVSPALPDSGYVIVKEIRLTGNRKTKDFIIRRELDFTEGDTLWQSSLSERIEKNRRKVFNTNLFVTADAKVDQTNPKEAIVEFDLREQWYILGFPIFQLADRNFNEWWYERNRDLSRTIYGVNLRHYNVRGRAEQLRVNLEFGFARYLEFAYRIPYIDRKRKLGVTVGASYNTTKNLAYRTDADKLVYLKGEDLLRERFYANVIFRRRNKYYDFQNLELRYATHTIADTVARINPNYFLNGRTRQKYFLASYGYTYDFRDKAQYPLRGFTFSAVLNRYGLLPGDDIDLTDLTVGFNRYKPLGGRWYFGMAAEAKTSYPQRQPYLQTRGLGYLNDLVRGYELFTIDGQHYAYIRNTLRYQLYDKKIFLKPLRKIRQFNTLPIEIYPNVFVDGGQSWNQYNKLNNSRFANHFLFGYGVGLDVVTWYNAVLRFHYAFTRDGVGGFRFNVAREF